MSRKSITERQNQLKSGDYKGEDYNIDADIESGPLGNRRCTDLLCLLIFLCATGAMGYIGFYAVSHGDPDRIMTPYDATGQFCGRSPGYENYPYLWFQNLESEMWIAYTVCVAACPTQNNAVADCKLSENSIVTSCAPEPAPYDSKLFLDRWCMPVYDTLDPSIQEKYNNIAGSFGLDDLDMYARDIRLSWKAYLICLFTVFVLIFFWNLMLNLFAEILAWISIFLVGAGLCTLGFMVKYYADENYPEDDTTGKWLNRGSYVLWALTGIYILAVLCSYTAIKISVKVLRVSAKVIMSNLRMIIVPVVGIVTIVVWIIFFAYCLLWLMSCGDMVSNQLESPTGDIIGTYMTYNWTDEEKYYMWAALFYFLWIVAFSLAATQYVLVVAVASWYFTQNSDRRGDFSILRGYYWLWRYNLGSILFGSFLIALVWFIRIVFEYISQKLNNGGENSLAQAAKFIQAGVRCCLDCCNRFVKYINETAYCQIALTGENFCTAAINGCLLTLKHAATFAFARGIGGIFNLLGKLAVTVANVLIGYCCVAYLPQLEIKVNSPIGPLLVIGLFSYCVATIFMSMYTTTTLCLLHSLYADVDICQQKSYDQMVGMNRPREMRTLVGDMSGSKTQPFLS